MMPRPVGKRSALKNRGPEAICTVTSLQSTGSYKKLQCGQKHSMKNSYKASMHSTLEPIDEHESPLVTASKTMMAKMQRLRFVTEVAPPRFISVIRRPLKKLLATIHEEESEIISRSLSVSLANSSTDHEKKL